MLIVDGHVHFHPCFDRDVFLSTAAERFADVAGAETDALGVLMLTESRGADAFGTWREGADPTGSWRFEKTAEPVSLMARDARGRRFAVVAGRQIAARGGLEVLALGTTERVPEGLAFNDAVDAALAAAPLVVIAWGFGKWWGERGRTVERTLDRLAGRIWLGDNAGRPAIIPAPRLFEKARATGTGVLPGSDPLPFPGHARSPVRAGLRIETVADPDRPLSGLLQALRAHHPATAFGRREPLLPFVRDQIRMQWVKRRR